MYSVADYVWMIADETRVSAYAAAIRASVKPGDRVLEVGAGFGFFSVIAARAGARRVDAVETNPAVHLGPRLAAANDCAERIVFHHLDAARLTLDEPADVLLTDLRGPTPFAGRSLAVLIDVRQRLLRDGGAVIPARDTVFVAPCRVPALVRRELHAGYGREAVVTSAVERIIEDTPYRCSIAPTDLIGAGRPWTRIDYANVESVDAAGDAEWTIDAAATVSGLAVWFDSELADGIGFSSAPGTASHAYRQLYLPLRAAVPVAAGDRLRIRLVLRLVLQDYIWAWQVFLTPAGAEREREVLSQNSLAETIIDPAELHRRAAPPRLGAAGGALRSMLAHIDGRASVQDLARALQREFPQLFADAGSAAKFVAEWTARIAEADQGASAPRPAI
jgi:type I protein arginine methyltransferase